ESEIARSKKEEAQGELHKKDPLHNAEPKNYVEPKIRTAMEETLALAKETAAEPAGSTRKARMLADLAIMAGAIRATFMRGFPGEMDAFTALLKEDKLERQPVGLGRNGPATNLAGTGADLNKYDPMRPSSD